MTTALVNFKCISVVSIIALLLLFFVNETSCKKPYTPPAISTPTGFLVIEGIINSGNDSTIIKITRTVNVGQVGADSVTGATVTVEDNQSGILALTERNKGIYVSPALNIDKTKQYRLRVKTPDNQVYLSDFEPVLTTPSIDSVGFVIQSSGLEVYVNTHDTTNNVKYYRWSYDEAWMFHSFFLSTVMDVKGALVPRGQNNEIYFCYNTMPSSDIPLAATANLSQSVLFQKQIAFIPKTSEKLELRYGIVVKQYALTADAYSFYSKLEKNSDQLGSIFDTQPSQIPGNIKCITNPQQPVLGYIGVSNVTSKTVFISNAVLPQSWVATYPALCLFEKADPHVPYLSIYLSEDPKQFEFIDKDTSHSTPICVDCTIRGNRMPPPFWKN